jgi:hypothetical protein
MNIDKIKNMDQKQWDAFRLESWLQKKIAIAIEVPKWYLKDKEEYVHFIKKTNVTLKAKGMTPKITEDQIEKLNTAEWNEYRKEMWVKKNAKYAPDFPPTWYLSSKDVYVTFLEKSSKK